MTRRLLFVVLALLQIALLHARAGAQDLAKKLIGEWQGSRHIEAYYPDGSFTLDPTPGVKPFGTWKLEDHRLITLFGDETPPMIVHIVAITDSELITTYQGRRFVHKRLAHQ
jgi:hypothetical protein